MPHPLFFGFYKFQLTKHFIDCRQYFDTPVLEGTGDELVAGKSAKIVGAPLSAKRAAGCNFYLPIPFRKNCMITYDGANARKTKKFGDNIYYNINYIQYPAGTDVKSFARDDLESSAQRIERVQRELGLVGSLAQPGADAGRAGLVVDQQQSSVNQAVDAIHAHLQLEPAERQKLPSFQRTFITVVDPNPKGRNSVPSSCRTGFFFGAGSIR